MSIGTDKIKLKHSYHLEGYGAVMILGITELPNDGGELVSFVRVFSEIKTVLTVKTTAFCNKAHLIDNESIQYKTIPGVAGESITIRGNTSH